jgi:hypothetical protein
MALNSDRWDAVDRLYHAALAQPANERAAFLADACAGDEELRREVMRGIQRVGDLACDVEWTLTFK